MEEKHCVLWRVGESKSMDAQSQEVVLKKSLERLLGLQRDGAGEHPG